jgi:hypothetical protein
VRFPRHPSSPAARRLGRGLIGALAGLSIASGQNLKPPEDPEEKEPTGFLAGSLLPDGGILKDVMIPQYSRDLLLSAVFNAEELEVITREVIDARRLKIEFFNNDSSPRGHIAMSKARYDSVEQFLTSDEPVSLVSDDLTANGSSLVYDLENTRGFLHGPVTATTAIDQRTSMNAKPARQALAAGALIVASATALPARENPDAPLAERIEEARLSFDELERLSEEAASRQPLLKAAADQGARDIAESDAKSEDATTTMADFFRAASLTSLLAAPLPATPPGDVPRPETAPDPSRTRITSDDGAFFDSKNGLLIFLKNVVLKDPRFNMSATEEVKVFFEPKETAPAAKAGPQAGEAPAAAGEAPRAEAPEPAAQAAEGKPGEGIKALKEGEDGLGDANFGDPRRIVATGIVVLEYKSEDPTEPPIKASARTVTYDLKTSEFILRGGSPWIQRGTDITSVPGNDAYIKIQKNGSFVTGNGGINLDLNIQGQGGKKDAKKK